MQNSCKFVLDLHAKLPAFTGKNTCSFYAKTPELQVKTPAKRRQKNCKRKHKNPYSQKSNQFWDPIANISVSVKYEKPST